MLNTTWTETYLPLYLILHVSYRYFWWSTHNVASRIFLVLSISLLTSIIGFIKCYYDENAEIQDWAFKHALPRRNSLETKCYSNWTNVYYQGNTSPRQNEYKYRYMVGCGNTASLTHGGPAARMRQMGQYFQVVLYVICIKVYDHEL